jgi:hypothetical protein
LKAYQPVNRLTPNLGGRISFVDHNSQLVSRLDRGMGAGSEAGQFISPHTIALDSHGDLYVGEVVQADWAAVFPDTEMPDKPRRFQKFARV